jgi:hypothetical protein
VLFLRGANPWQPAGAVPDLGALVNLARRLLEANKERFGHITTGDQHRGQEHWVYVSSVELMKVHLDLEL